MAQNTKKQQPKPANNTSKAPTSVQDLDDEDVEIEEEGDEGDEEGGDKPLTSREVKKLPPAKRVAVRVGNIVDRLQRQLDVMKSWTGGDQEAARTGVQMAQEALKTAAETLAKVPDDWRPSGARGKGGESKEITPGMLVRITEKRYPEYQDAVSEENARGIRVEQILGNRLKCKLADGMMALFPRGHVTIDTDAAAAAS